MLKPLPLVCLSLLAASPVLAGAAPLWQKVVAMEFRAKTKTQDFPEGLFALSDGSFMALSLSAVGGGPPDAKYGYALTRLDPQGKVSGVQWLGYYEGDFRGPMIRTRDGGYLTGLFNGASGKIVKFNAQGREVWKKEYDRQAWHERTVPPELAEKIRRGEIDINNAFPHERDHTVWYLNELADGKIQALFGQIFATLDAQGNHQSEVHLDRDLTHFTSAHPTPDGGFVTLGITYAPVPEGASAAEKQRIWNTIDLFVDRFDANGQLLWDKKFGGNKEDHPSTVLPTADGGFLVAGHTDSFAVKHTSPYLIKLDADGNKQWERTVASMHAQEALSSVGDLHATPDGGYVFVSSDRDTHLFKVDAQGNKLWEKTYGCGYSRHLIPTLDGGYLIMGAAGTCGATSPAWFDLYFVKTDAQGNTGPAPKQRS